MTQNKPSYDEMRRLLWRARDIILAQGESMDPVVQLNQHGWLHDVNPLLKDFDPNRPITPTEKLKAAISHMTAAEEAALAEEAYRIVSRADREFKRHWAEMGLDPLTG